MTDTTDIAALRRQAETAKVCGGIFAISGKQALSLLDKLEAERQRAETASAGWLKVIDERYALEQKSRNYEQVAHGLAEEIAELRAKLANPVVLPKYTGDLNHETTFLRGVEATARKIIAAGFTVKEQ